MKIDQLRAAIEAKASAIDAALNAQREVAEAVNDVLSHYDRVAADDNFLSGVLASDGGEYAFALGASIDPAHAGRDARTLLLLIGRDHIEKQARKYLEGRAKNQPAGLSRSERTTRIARLKSELRDLELAEERMIIMTEGPGGFIPRRPEADPKIILEVWSENA